MVVQAFCGIGWHPLLHFAWTIGPNGLSRTSVQRSRIVVSGGVFAYRQNDNWSTT
jgi:hypothetical protein